MPSSSRRIRSFSASVSVSRESLATWSTSFMLILASATALELLQMGVLKGEALAAHACEVHGGDHVVAFSLDAHEQAFAPARVAELGADAEGQIIVLHGGRRGRRLSHRGRRGARGVQQHELLRGNLEQEARGLAEAVALDAAMERVGEPEPLLGARDADVAEATLLLELLGLVHRPRVGK